MSGPTVPIAPIPLARSSGRLAAVPVVLLLVGLIAAAAGLLRGDVWGMALRIEGRHEPRPGDEETAVYRAVYPGYVRTMGMTLVRGRDDLIPVRFVPLLPGRARAL